jgi:Domain of unknown function (DUF1772)
MLLTNNEISGSKDIKPCSQDNSRSSPPLSLPAPPCTSTWRNSRPALLDDRASLAEWKPAYKRGFAMQASLAIIGFLLGVIAARADMDWRWLAGGLLLLANWPFTLIVMLPTNKLLMEIAPQNAGPQSRELIKKWGRLHAVRSALGAVATMLFLWASLQ